MIRFSISMLPISVNHIYGRGRGGRTFKTDEAEGFESVAYYALLRVRPKQPISTPCKLVLHYYFKDKVSFTKSDVDNLNKQMFDALQKARIIKNDNLVQEVTARKIFGKPNGVEGAVDNFDVTAIQEL